jgi:hypothetical protein
MADDIRLVVTVENKSVLEAIKTTDKLESGVKKLSSTYAREGINYNKYRKGIEALAKEYGKTDQELRKYANSVRSSNKADKLAKATTDAATKATKALTLARREATAINNRLIAEARSEKLALEQSARASRESANAKRMLRMEFREGYAAQVQYRAGQMRLNQAQRLGMVTADQYQVQLAALHTQLQANTVAGVANGERMRATGLVMQQTGYQVGDFLVQVQGGTNVMVAFGQQATQLAGLLTVLGRSTTMIALGAALSILIPLATALGGAFLRTRRETDDTADSVNELNSAIESLDSTLHDFAVTKRAAAAGMTVAEMFGGDALSEAMQELSAARAAVAQYGNAAAFEFIPQAALDRETTARENLIAAEERLADLRAMQDGERQANADREELSLTNQLALERQIAQYGEDSNQVRFLQLNQTLDQYRAIIEAQYGSNELTRTQADDLIEQKEHLEGYKFIQDAVVRAQELAEEAAKGIADQMQRAADATMSFLNNLRSAGSSIPGLQAEIAALEAGATSGQASAASYTANAMASDEYQAATGEPILVAALNAEIAAAGRDIERVAILQDRLAELTRTESTAGSGSSGSSLSDQAAEAIASLQAQFALQEALRGQTEEHILVRRALGDSYSQIGAEQIASLEEQARLIAVVTEADEQRVRINETVANSVANGLSSMVDGTVSVKEAFKDMARSIIKELYDIFVVQQLVNSISGSLGGGKGKGGNFLSSLFQNANGNVFSGGSQVQAYANGGVVDGPTYFPMSGSKTGLMGEAGPEAIMPLKRGSNGKLGVEASGSGSQAVNITQNFSFSANGDETVKRIIAEAAPQIANLTQKQIMDQRRRGGSMKSTFG